VPALAYATYARPEQGGDYTYLQVVLGYMVARVLISLLFIPAYFRGNLLTAYELLRIASVPDKELRCFLFLVMRALGRGRTRPFAASLVLSAVLSSSLPGCRIYGCGRSSLSARLRSSIRSKEALRP